MTAQATRFSDQARARAKTLLGSSMEFRDMNPSEQMALYRQTVNDLSQELAAAAQPESIAMLGPVPPASRLIDDKRHLNQRIDQLGDIASDFVEAVDFPAFVSDLLTGVFDANLAVTVKQMEAYANLLKQATASLSKFVNAIDNTSAFGYLADNQGDDFSIDFEDDEESGGNGSQRAVLTDKEGNVLARDREDIGDNELKAKIMDAKIAMAREQRALLREILLMGVTRLVVQKGNVKAGVLFDFKATEKIAKQDKAAVKDATSTGSSVSASGGLLGTIFGGPRGGSTFSHQQSQISVSSAKSVADTSLAAKLTGSVDITFMSDYFKLDNFAAMYGPIAREGVAGPAPAPAAGAPPAPAPALPVPAPVPAAPPVGR
jgi:hypothetical protein